VAASNDDVKYSLGSVLNHVLLHQTVIGEEAIKQMAMVEETPDVIIGCTGGGSNFSGLMLPFAREKLAGRIDPVIRAVEPAAAPSLTRGSYQFDFGDTGQMTPLVKMYTLGHPFIPEPIHAGGLRYHGMAPLVSHLQELGVIESVALHQTETFEKAVQFARVEGIIPGPEPTHAVAEAMLEAERAKEAGEEKVILFNLSGHGHFDMAAYQAHLGGELVDYEHPQQAIDAAMAKVPVVAE
jgi:tryptophan synthase beta chain